MSYDLDAPLQVEFHGVKSSSSSIHMDGATGAVRVNVRSSFGTEKLAPSATLNRVMTCSIVIEILLHAHLSV